MEEILKFPFAFTIFLPKIWSIFSIGGLIFERWSIMQTTLQPAFFKSFAVSQPSSLFVYMDMLFPGITPHLLQ